MKKLALALLLCLSHTFTSGFSAIEFEEQLKKAEEGDLKAQTTVGFLYYEAKELPKDPEKAIYWSRLASESGHAPAQINLGYFYSIGFGVPKDTQQAIYWYERAAKQGSALANYNLGTLYNLGAGVEKNPEKAAEYIKKAAQGDYPPAFLTLGGMYANGYGVKKDGYEAARQFKKAAELGDIEAMMSLGKLYAHGIGVPIDFEESRIWISKAASLGDKDAKAALKALPAMEARKRQEDRRLSQDYVFNLKKKYASRLRYETAYARTVVQGFDLDCRTRDGRYLPLENVLLARIASMDKGQFKFTIRASSRGEDVRIYDDMTDASGGIVNTMVAFEINKWGEIRSPSIRMEAVLNSCLGSYGPIWVMPDK